MTDPFPALADLTFRAEQREAFTSGVLREHWYHTYPALFDDRDIRNVRNRPERHFYEWLTAVSLYHATGWHSLVEKYQFGHARKQSTIQRLDAETLVLFFETQKRVYKTPEDQFGMIQAPDLLLYDPTGTDYAFCEVKGPGDVLRPEQSAYFQALRAATGRQVYTVRVRPAPF